MGAAPFVEFRIRLAMSTATVASTAVVAATVEPAATTAMEAVAAAEAAAITAVPAMVTTAEAFMAIVTSTTIIAMTIVAAAVIAAATVEATAIVAAVIPGAGADEDSTKEVVRAVVAVGGASVRVVAVVTVGADRGGADGAVHGTYPDAHANLRLGGTSSKKQNSH